jgi:2-polyprenyl-3-methyl-5-hydroxy-6-metoxy-1,4-benzoquinol methylase
MEEKSETTIDYHKLHKEFSIFITQQKNIVNFMKENVKMVEKLRLEYLDEIVSEKFNIVKESHVCDVCARGFRNLKALATHQRSCIASEQQKGSEEEEKEE